MQETCPRCDTTRSLVEGTPAAFCGNCGLPQLRVSAELTETGTLAAEQLGLPATAQQLDWSVLLRFCAVASAVGVLICILLPGALSSGVAASLALFLLPLLTMGTGMFYLRRRPLHPMSAGVGARMGMVIALFVLGGVTLVSAVTGFVLRYHYHSHVLEQSVDLQMAQLEGQMRTMAAGPPTEAMIAALKTPEWRAGMFLSTQLVAAVLLLAAGGLCGALAGMLLRARQRRDQSAS